MNSLHKIILFYWSPNQKKKNIQETIEYFESVENNTIIIGDLNIPGRNWNIPYLSGKGSGKQQMKESLINVLLSQGTRKQFVNFPTFKTNKNILDIVVAHKSYDIKMIREIESTPKCDHESHLSSLISWNRKMSEKKCFSNFLEVL